MQRTSSNKFPAFNTQDKEAEIPKQLNKEKIMKRPITRIIRKHIAIMNDNLTIVKKRNSTIPNRIIARCLSDSCPQDIGNYEMGSRIGIGAYAVVKRAINRISGETVAIKIYEKYKMASSQKRNCVNREIRILKVLNHSNIIKLNEVIETENSLYLIMELAKGTSIV